MNDATVNDISGGVNCHRPTLVRKDKKQFGVCLNYSPQRGMKARPTWRLFGPRLVCVCVCVVRFKSLGMYELHQT
jgi:hypothetical protein